MLASGFSFPLPFSRDGSKKLRSGIFGEQEYNFASHPSCSDLEFRKSARFPSGSHLGFSPVGAVCHWAFIFLFSARITGVELERYYFDDESIGTHCVEELAMEIANLSQGWNPVDILSGGETTELAKVLAGVRIRTIECRKEMLRAATDVACNQVSKIGAPHLDCQV